MSIENHFTLEKTTPVGFFYRLPKHIRRGYEPLLNAWIEKDDVNWVKQHEKITEYYMKNISPEQFLYIRETAPDFEYFVFYEIFIILQPIISMIIKEYDLYNRYPEYVI